LLKGPEPKCEEPLKTRSRLSVPALGTATKDYRIENVIFKTEFI